MKFRALASVMIVATVVSGCATKRYGRVQPITGFEKVQYTCRDVELEIAKVQSFQQQVTEGAEFNAASALGILGDFGIGNSMEKGSAMKSAAIRLGQLRDLQAEKHCGASSSNASQTTYSGGSGGIVDLGDVRKIPAKTPSGYCLMAPADYRGTGAVNSPAITDALPRCGAGM